MISFPFRACTVELHSGFTITRFLDGSEVHALWTAQPGQEETARELGFPDAVSLNAGHDLAHTVVAVLLGQPYSPTLWGVAHNVEHEHWAREEALVLSAQAYCNAAGIDVRDLAARLVR